MSDDAQELREAFFSALTAASLSWRWTTDARVLAVAWMVTRFGNATEWGRA